MGAFRKSSVLLADAEPLARRGAVAALNEHRRLHVCAEADGPAQARDLCVRHRPRVLVLDPAQGDGWTLLKDLPRWSAGTRAVVLTALEDAGNVQRAFQAGALGYVSRLDAAPALVAAVLAALEAERHLGPRAERALLGGVARGVVQVGADALARLSQRERDIFRRIGEGKLTRVIAEELHVSMKTVETHRQHIREKLGLATGLELTRRAVLLHGGGS